MPDLFGGKKFSADDWGDRLEKSISGIQNLIADGYKFYVTENIKEDSTDPWSGMPNTHTDYYAFDNKADAAEFANIAKANVFSSQKNQVKYLDDLLNELQRDKADRDASIQRDRDATAKRKAYQDNLPKWRNKRTSVLKVYNEINHLKRQIKELEPEYNRLLAELKDELDKSGVQYNNIEDVLDTEFLKQFRNKK